jgi:hypothetical protein
MSRTLLFFLWITALAFGGLPQNLQAQIPLMNFFNLSSDGADVLLEWEMQTEEGVSEFRLFRKYNDEATFTHVATLPVSGLRKYSYLDDNIFKAEHRVLQYELQVVMGGQVYSFGRTLTHNPTSIQRTWGSIKAMFR